MGDSEKLKRMRDLFNLEADYTLTQLKEAYRDLAHVWHPDKHQHNERLRKKANDKLIEINQGYKFLKVYLENNDSEHSSNSNKNTTGESSSVERDKSYGWHEYETKKQYYSAPNMNSGSEKKKNDDNEIKFTDLERKPKSSLKLPLITYMFLVVLLVWFGLNDFMSSNEFEKNTNISVEKPFKREVAKRLDEFNGFKEFNFGMKTSEIEELAKPFSKVENDNNNHLIFNYISYMQKEEYNELFHVGNYPIDGIYLHFFNDSLYRIGINFSENDEKLLETFSYAYGVSYNNDSWTRGEKALEGKSWYGDSTWASVLGTKDYNNDIKWDALVIMHTELNRKAINYETNENRRAGENLNVYGLNGINLKMRIEDFLRYFNNQVSIEELEFNQKKLIVNKFSEFKIGYYPISSLTGYFFNDSMYRLDIGFDDENKDIFKTFTTRFPNAEKTSKWTYGNPDKKLAGLEYQTNTQVVTLLGTKSGRFKEKRRPTLEELRNIKIYSDDAPSLSLEEHVWDTVIFRDLALIQEKQQFEKDAPKRAAEDL